MKELQSTRVGARLWLWFAGRVSRCLPTCLADLSKHVGIVIVHSGTARRVRRGEIQASLLIRYHQIQRPSFRSLNIHSTSHLNRCATAAQPPFVPAARSRRCSIAIRGTQAGRPFPSILLPTRSECLPARRTRTKRRRM